MGYFQVILLQIILQIHSPPTQCKQVQKSNIKYTSGFSEYLMEKDLIEKQSKLTTYIINFIKNIGNDRFSVSNEQNESRN